MTQEELDKIFNACKDKNFCFVCGGALEEIVVQLPSDHPNFVKRIPILFADGAQGKRCARCGLLYAK